jgi:hypothetical protein
VVAEGSTILIQLLLVAGILAITLWLFLSRGIAFALFGVIAVMFPNLVTRLAHLVGVGRGADLLLYATVVVLLGFLALQESRTKAAEKRTTHLARRIALDEAEQPDQVRARSLGTAGTE